MDFKSYTNALKALIHIHKSTDSFGTALQTTWNDFPLTFNVSVDDRQAFLNITYTIKIETKVFQMRLFNMHEDSKIDESYCCATLESSPVINYVELDPTNIILYNRGTPPSNRLIYNINTLEEEHFQNSTVNIDNNLEFYLYLKEMYFHYNEFMPTMVGFSMRYNPSDELFCTDEFREFATKKLWGIAALI